MNTKNILIVEDDFLNRRVSKKYLSENGYTVFEAKNAQEALNLLKNEQIEMAILDINLGEGKRDGISLGQELYESFNIPFIYLTAYEGSALIEKAVATMPHAYLTKPYKDIELITSIELALRQFAGRKKQKQTIIVKENEYNIDLPIEEIEFIESDGNYLLINTSQKVFKKRSTIKEILTILPTSTFVQTHRAFIVNKEKINKFNIKEVIINSKVIPISKYYVDNIQLVCK
ncbi:MAG: response regulator transcription factor [Sphingobacteriales bacterium]|nr:response regulator transcription factor [Sphingobacteriales bacterium]